MKQMLLPALQLLSKPANAQYENMLHKNSREKSKLPGNFWGTKTVNNQYDSTKFFDEVMAIRKMAAQHRDDGLEMDTYMCFHRQSLSCSVSHKIRKTSSKYQNKLLIFQSFTN